MEGAGHLGESARRLLLAPYQGRCLGVGQLNALLKAVTDHYLDRGYVTTRAYLPQQDLASGTLRIIVSSRGLASAELSRPSRRPSTTMMRRVPEARSCCGR
ncbi:POTRA domain-containing protein [Pseudomonas aeruginosa]